MGPTPEIQASGVAVGTNRHSVGDKAARACGQLTPGASRPVRATYSVYPPP
jgi:hypothetical protein